MIHFARKLRKTMTRQEVKLWVYLRSWRERGYHFRRQSPRDGFIVDFVCLKHKLIVEVDGGQHGLDEHATRDRARDRSGRRQPWTAAAIRTCASCRRFQAARIKRWAGRSIP